MKRHGTKLWTAVLLAALLLAACGETTPPAQTPAAPVQSAAPSAGTGTAEGTEGETANPAAETESPEAAAPETSAPASEWRELDREELDLLEQNANSSDNGFFVCTFDRPEEIDWAQVFGSGAGGLGVALGDDVIEAYEAVCGELTGDLLAVYPEDMYDYAERMTGIPYAVARKPVAWQYLPEFNLLCTESWDPNFQEISFTAGYARGDVYQLYYTRADYEHYIMERPFVMTASIRDGSWRYISNLPTDAPAPLTLLEFYYDDSGEMIENIKESIVPVPASWEDENTPRFWAVVEAKADGVRYVLDRFIPRFEGEGAVIPEGNISSGVLNAGERIAILVSDTWNPYLRLTASLDNYWGEFQFGQDVSLNLPLDHGPRPGGGGPGLRSRHRGAAGQLPVGRGLGLPGREQRRGAGRGQHLRLQLSVPGDPGRDLPHFPSLRSDEPGRGYPLPAADGAAGSL